MRYTVHVKTGAPRSFILMDEGILRVSVKARPENNKANFELIKLLAKHFGKPVQIISGFTAKKKIIEVFD